MAFLVCLLVACLAASTSASCCAGMTMNALGIELTESSEGYVDHVYNDAAGVRKQPAICRSHSSRSISVRNITCASCLWAPGSTGALLHWVSISSAVFCVPCTDISA
jgi:hypothetical protein